MKRHFYKIITMALLIGVTVSCSKDEALEVDLSKYNYDTFDKLPIDDYIYNKLTKPYNVEVVYRFDRSHTDVSKNISPPRIEQVQPAVDMIINGFLKVYEKVAGAEFTKTYTPKQFVLFGSHAYNTNGSVTLGTADGGRRVVLYDVNNINEDNPEDIKRRLRTIHHEFTHIINQIVDIPPSFRTITTDYVADWIATANSEEEALRLGFISRYSRSSYGEDFAETVAHLLVEGQAFYDARIAASTADGAAKLREKEAVVQDYFKQYFNIDFKELQYEFFLAMSEIYNDQTQTFFGLLDRGNVAEITVDLEAGAHYPIYGQSEEFALVWQAVKDGLAAYQNNAGRFPTVFKMAFTSRDVMQLQVTYKNPSNLASTFYAYYDYEVGFTSNNEITFSYYDEGIDATNYNNGRVIKNSIQPLLDYFDANTFVTDWLPPTLVGYGNSMTFGKFSVVSDDTNYIYGPVVLR
jgi:substrate import-associated zinc metallohydrolase lipoprotein